MAKQTFFLLTLWKYFTLALLITSTCGISDPSKLNVTVESDKLTVDCSDYQESNYIEIINDYEIYRAIKVIVIKNCPTPNLPFAKLDDLNFTVLEINNLTDGFKLLPEHFTNLNYVKELSILDTVIENLPENLFQDIPNLIELNLNVERLCKLPTKIFKPLTSLKILNIICNNLISLDDNIFESLKNLQELYIHGTPLTSLPTSIFEPLKHLRALVLDDTKISSLQNNIFDSLTSLELLGLEENSHLTSLSESLLRNNKLLQEIEISDSKLSNLPVNLFNGSKANSLYLNGNELTNFSKNHIMGMSELKYVDLSHNNLSEISKQLIQDYGKEKNITIKV